MEQTKTTDFSKVSLGECIFKDGITGIKISDDEILAFSGRLREPHKGHYSNFSACKIFPRVSVGCSARVILVSMETYDIKKGNPEIFARYARAVPQAVSIIVAGLKELIRIGSKS